MTVEHLMNPVAHVIDGVTRQLSHDEATALHGSSNLRTALTNFAFPWNNTIIQFHKGVAVQVEPALAAALDEAGAPVFHSFWMPAEPVTEDAVDLMAEPVA